MAFMAPLALGTAGAGGAAATAGLFGTGGTFAIGQALSTVGTAFSVMGALQAGRAGQQAAAYNMESAQMEGAAREAAQRRESSRQLGSIRAGIAKSGARMEGTPLMVLAESAANAEIDALNTRFSTGRQVELERMRGAEARRAAYWGAGTSLLAGASRLI